MFWSVVIDGLSLLLKWRVWVALLILMAVHFGLHMAVRVLGLRFIWRWPHATVRLVQGLEWLISSVIVSTGIYTLFPILMGLDRVTPLWVVIRDWTLIVVAGLLTGFAVFVVYSR